MINVRHKFGHTMLPQTSAQANNNQRAAACKATYTLTARHADIKGVRQFPFTADPLRMLEKAIGQHNAHVRASKKKASADTTMIENYNELRMREADAIEFLTGLGWTFTCEPPTLLCKTRR